MCVLLSGQYGIWVLILNCGSVLKAWISCLESDPGTHSSEVSPGIHTQLYGITLLSSLFSTTHLALPRSLEAPFPELQPEIWDFTFPTPLHSSHYCLCVQYQVVRG